MGRAARGTLASAPKKPKATPAAAESTPTKKAKKAKKATKKDSDPAPAPLNDSDDDLEPTEPFKATLTTKYDRLVRKIHCTIPDGTTAVLQKKKQKREFAQTIKLTSRKPFSLEPILFTKGPYAGLHVLILQPERDEHETFPFLDLPAEIRNMIYSLVLERPGFHVDLSGKHSGIIQSHWYSPGRGYISRHDQPYSSSLMRVNKQISVESTPYLFSLHTFEFSDSTMMQRFLEYIGPERTKSLVSVQVNQQYNISTKQAFDLLSPAVSLTKLVTKSTYCYPYGYRYTPDWPSVLLQLVQSLCSAGRSRDEVFDIFEIRGAVRGSCQKHGVFTMVANEDCEKEATAYKDFYKKLRDDIDKEIEKVEAKKDAIRRGSPVKTRAGRKTKAIDYSGMEE